MRNIIDSTATVIDESIIGAGGGCFRSGTLVQQENGKVIPIQDIVEGDEVLAFDEFGDLHVAKVTKLHIHKDPQPLFKVDFWGGVIYITPNHWVLNQYNAFVEIQTLEVGHDAVVSGMGHLRPIHKKEFIGKEVVYNLTVEKYHTFIANGIRVHNGGHRERYPVVTGSGGGGSSKGSGGRAAIVAPDSLQSYAALSVIDLIGEGQIGGLVNGAQSIYFNNTPLMNANGTYNFLNSVSNINTAVVWDHREGTPNQTPMTGFSDIETLYDKGNVAVRFDTFQTFTITSLNTDRVRVVMSVNALQFQDLTTGDVNGTSVDYHFEISKDGGSYIKIGSTVTISGKTGSTYQRSSVFTLPKPAVTGWTIKVVRETPDSTLSNLSNSTFLSNYSEIVDTKINYTNSALVSCTLDPAVFSSIPSRAYLIDGLMIRVPSNYNAATRVYTGIWNGSYILAVSSNPAWILFDLLTSKRYGIGSNISDSQVDVAALYQIGIYCDEMIPDGLGGTGVEPRFSINTSIQTQTDAYQLIANISSAFRGMSYWGGGMVSFRQDSPKTPSRIFNQANVVGGNFNYSSSARKDRHSAVNVTWNNPAANYVQAIEYVDDQTLIQQLGIKVSNVVAFGCTSRGQAHRAGRWLLYTEKYETNVITFNTGLDGAMMLPGEVIMIHDAFKTGKRMGGRILSATLNSITVDSPVTLSGAPTGGTINVFITMPNGSFSQRAINESSGVFSTFTWTTVLTELPVNNAVYVLGDQTLPVLARVLAVAQVGKSPNEYTVSCTQYNPDKFTAIESSMTLTVPQTSITLPYVTTLSNLVLLESTYFVAPGVLGSKLHVSWAGMATQFRVAYRINTPTAIGNWITDIVLIPSYDIVALHQGSTVDVSISGLDLTGNWSQVVVGTATILGSFQPPQSVATFTATGLIRSVQLNWTYPTNMNIDFDHVKIMWSATSSSVASATLLASINATSYLVTGLNFASTPYYFWIWTVNASGVNSVSPLYVTATTLDEAGAMVTTLTGQIGSSALNTELATRLSSTTTAITAVNTTVAGLNASYTVKIDANGYVTGYGLASDTTNGVTTSSFAIRADKFSIASPSGPSGGAPIVPFSVLTTPTAIDGTVFPAGVYINTAYITKITASQINSTGLTIRDSAGNVIFGAGTGLNYNLITGATAPQPNATRNVYRGLWTTATAYAVGDIVLDTSGNGWSCILINTSSSLITTPISPAISNLYWTLYAAKGIDAITAILSNENHVFPADSSGVVTDYSSSGTTISVYDGVQLLNYDGVGTASGSWKIVSTPTNITVGGLTSSSGVLTVGNQSLVTSTVDTSAIIYTISGMRLNGSAFSITAQQSFAKSKAGISPYIVQLESTNGNEFRVGQGSSTLIIAHVFQGGVEVTSSLSAAQFRWRRVSIINEAVPYDDATWNALYATGYKQISVSVDVVFSKATFFCDILTLI